MADQAAEEQLYDVSVAEASAAYKFYLNNEKKILGTTAVVIIFNRLGAGRKRARDNQPDVYERAVADLQSGDSNVLIGRDL